MGIPKKAEHKFTYKDYRTWPDDERWELIDGVAYDMSPAPSLDHQRISRKIVTAFDVFLKEKECEAFPAPFDVFIPETPERNINDVSTVVQPDISVVCDKGKLISRGCFGSPDLVVEILFPSTMKKDLSLKFDLFQNAKVREYWVVDPGNRFVRVYRLKEDGLYDDGILHMEEGNVITSSVLDGLKINLKEVFG